MRPRLCAGAQKRTFEQSKLNGPASRVGRSVSGKLFNVLKRPRHGRSALLLQLPFCRLENFGFTETISVHPAQIRNRAHKHGEQGQQDLCQP